MSFSDKKAKILIYSTVSLSVICAILRCVCLLFYYDTDIGYYTASSYLPTLTSVIIVASALFLILFSLIFMPKVGEIKPLGGSLKYYAIIPAATFLLPLMSAVGNLALQRSYFEFFVLIASVCAMTFFALLAFSDNLASSATIVFGVGVILWLALAWLSSYTNFFVPMNSPGKVFFHFACVGAALLVVGELRCLCATAKPKTYYCYLCVAIFTLSAYTLPYVVGSLSGITEKSDATAAQSVVLIGLLIYACIRVFSLLTENPTLVQTESAPEIEEATESADATTVSEQTAESVKEENKEDNIQ